LVAVRTEDSGLLVCDAVWWVECNANLNTLLRILDRWNLNTEVPRSFETAGKTQTTRRHIPVDGHLQQHRSEMLISRIQYLPSVLFYMTCDVLFDPYIIAYRSRPLLHGIWPT